MFRSIIPVILLLLLFFKSLRCRDTNPEIFHFLQITDTHITFKKPWSIYKFEKFMNLVDFLNPEFVLHTGDIVHSKYVYPRTGISKLLKDHRPIQCEKQWGYYYDQVKKIIRKKSDFPKKGTIKFFGCENEEFHPFIIDVTGNHDNFNTIRYGSQKRQLSEKFTNLKNHCNHIFSFSYTSKSSNESYLFIHHNSNPSPIGNSPPYNFFGVMSSSSVSSLQKEIDRSSQKNYARSFFFGHHPTSLVHFDSKVKNRLKITPSIEAFFSGHLHNFNKLDRDLMSWKETYYELTLGSFQFTRGMFRIIAVDERTKNWAFSDVHVDDPMFVVSLSPIDCKYIPKRVKLDTEHIRLLIFSEIPVTNITATIDNGYIFQEWQQKEEKSNLYLIKWLPFFFNDNTSHILNLTITNQNNQTIHKIFPFRTNGERCPSKITSKLMLNSDWERVFHIFACLGYIAASSSLIFGGLIFDGFLYLSKTERFGLLGFGLWMAFCPLFLGELADGHFGLVFANFGYVHFDFSNNWERLFQWTMTGGTNFVIGLYYYCFEYCFWVFFFGVLRTRSRWLSLDVKRCLFLGMALLQYFLVRNYWDKIVRRYGVWSIFSVVLGFEVFCFVLALKILFFEGEKKCTETKKKKN